MDLRDRDRDRDRDRARASDRLCDLRRSGPKPAKAPQPARAGAKARNFPGPKAARAGARNPGRVSDRLIAFG
jgi:hypothetical protein